MSVWENLVSLDSESSQNINDLESRSISLAVKKESLQKLVDYIAKSREKFSDLRACPEATSLVLGILREGVAESEDTLAAFGGSRLTDNNDHGREELCEMVGPSVGTPLFSDQLQRMEDSEFRESVKRVWGWIQRNHAVLTYLTVAVSEKCEASRAKNGEVSVAPSMRCGLKHADEILYSYFSGFMRGYSVDNDIRDGK
jgi:hypothetical protein